MAQKKIFEVTSKKCKDLKRLDRNQMQQYLGEVYESGKAAGTDSFDADLCLEAIGEIKGIGETKVKQIKLAMIAAGAKFNEGGEK